MTSQSFPQNETASFALAGPSRHAPSATLPVRGDLAHIRLAGEVFVPHYAVPMPHTVIAAAQLVATPIAGAEELARVEPGTRFDVLDIAGSWAWGCIGGDGPVGYLPLAAIGKD